MSNNSEQAQGGENTLSAVMEKRQSDFRTDMWLSQQPHIERIRSEGLEQFIIREGDPQLVRNIFRTDRHFILGCMDGRQAVCRIAFAGPGVFWTDEQTEAVVAEFKRSGIKIKRVYRHRDCGAEKAVKAQLMTEQNMNADQAEKAIRDKVHHLAELLGADVGMYESMKYSRFHYERMLLLIGTEAFDIQSVDGVSAFQFNGRFLPDVPSVLHRVNLAIEGIAFGDHGPGKEMFGQTPFVIGIIGDSTNPEYSFTALNQHLQPLLSKYGKLVEVHGFDVPKEYLPQKAASK